MSNACILVADDEAEIRELLAKYLKRENYRVDVVAGGRQALACCRAKTYDLVVLDLMMPDMDGYDVCRELRTISNCPVLILSAKDAEADKVSGLMIGADDYVTKPFSINELIARVRAHIRRAALIKRSVSDGRQVESLRPIVAGRGIEVYPERHEVRKLGRIIPLTPKEFDLLVLLLRDPGRVFTKRQIFNAVWGDIAGDENNTIMVHIRRLRSRIEDDPDAPVLIRTVRGIGYCFADD